MSGPVPARVDGTAKAALLSLIDDAVDAGWTLNRACAVVEQDRGRAWRWQQRRAGGGLDDARPGGNPIHGLLEWEEAEILALFDEWGDVDRSQPPRYEHGCGRRPTVDRCWPVTALPCELPTGTDEDAVATGVSGTRTTMLGRLPFERCVAAKHAYPSTSSQDDPPHNPACRARAGV